MVIIQALCFYASTKLDVVVSIIRRQFAETKVTMAGSCRNPKLI